MSEVVLHIPPKFEYLALVRALVSSTAGLDPHIVPHRIDDIRLAVSEATTNAIEAQISDGCFDPIRVRCALVDGQVIIDVLDKGVGFDPTDLVPHPPVTDPQRLEFERGLGIPLMRRLMDEHEISPTSSGTSVRMVVYTPPPDA